MLPTTRLSIVVSGLTHATLVRVNRVDRNVEPWLAESWTSSADGLTYTLKLRQGVSSRTARRSRRPSPFSFAALHDERPGSRWGKRCASTAGRSRCGARPSTVSIIFPAPFGPDLRAARQRPDSPTSTGSKRRCRAAHLRNAWEPATPPAELVGLGPFVLADLRPGERLVFARNPHYWREGRRGAAAVPRPACHRHRPRPECGGIAARSRSERFSSRARSGPKITRH